jgi:hypothetical protein
MRGGGAASAVMAQFPNLLSAQAVGALMDGERLRLRHLERM